MNRSMLTRMRRGAVAIGIAVCAVVALPDPSFAASVPVPPRSVRIAPGNARATVRWHAPSNGGSPITAYEIEVFHDQVTLGIYQFKSSATQQTVVGLKNGQTLTFKVAAKNGAGWSKSSARSAPATIGAPVPIGAPTGTAGSGRATVSWHAAASNGAAVNQYRVIPRINGHAQPVRLFKSAKTKQVLTGLQHGAQYTFEIEAHNARGWSAPSDPSAEVKIK